MDVVNDVVDGMKNATIGDKKDKEKAQGQAQGKSKPAKAKKGGGSSDSGPLEVNQACN